MSTPSTKAIRIVIGGLAIGGAERHLSYVLPQLVSRGWHVKIVTLSDRDDLRPLFEAAGITIISPDFGWMKRFRLPKKLHRPFMLLHSFWHLCKEFKRDRSTLTHFFLPEAYGLGMPAALLMRLKAPKIMSRRSLNDYKQRRPILGWLENAFHPHIILAQGNSQRIIDQLVDEGIPVPKTQLIYNGIPFDTPPKESRSDIRKMKGFSDDAIIMLIVANLIPYKAHSDLLDALALIADKLPQPWHLLSLGRDDGIGNDLIKKTHALGLENNVQWLGSRRDIGYYFAISDFNILCSHEEGLSNAVLEAMHAGLPMVATDVGGNAEAILDGVCGTITPPRNIEALAKAIVDMASNKEQRKAYGKNAKQRVEEHFTLSRCVDEYEQTYTRLINAAQT